MKIQFHILFPLLSCLLLANISAFGQEEEPKFRAFEYEGEIYVYGELEAIDIIDRFPNKAQLRRGRRKLAKFTRLRWNIHRVYPYAVKVGQVMADARLKMASIEDPKEKKSYLKSREKELFSRYEKDLRKMSRSQGKILVKLIYRQTGESTYVLIKDTKSGASAFLWQSVGRLFGINLKSDYNADEEIMLEAIVRELERGGYNIAYRTYNYELID